MLSLVLARAFGWEAVEKMDALQPHCGVSVFLHQSVKKAGGGVLYVKLLPSTSRTRSSYPAEKTLPSGVDVSPEMRFVCPWPVSGVASPVEL